MVSAKVSALLLGAGALVSAAPAPTPTELKPRAASCTFSGTTGAAAAIQSKASCSTIVLNNVIVPAGTTLDLTKLNSGTTVTFQGTTSFGYKEWEGPLISVSGTKITVQGASGHVIDGNGPKWWDGQGSNGGKTKPKFFAAHSLKQSTISNLNVKNTPVQGFSINSATDLTLDHITIDNSAGDADTGGHNTVSEPDTQCPSTIKLFNMLSSSSLLIQAIPILPPTQLIPPRMPSTSVPPPE